MKVAVISDVHENIHNLCLFFEQVKEYKPEKILFLGDFMNLGVAKVLASSKVPVISVWGNNDGDKVAITKISLSGGSNLSVSFETFDFLEIDSRKMFITHYAALAKPMAKSGEFDAVFYGHNHQRNIDKVGDCLVVNPGEISAHKTGIATFAIYDTKLNEAEIIEIDGSITLKTEEAVKHLDKVQQKYIESKGHQY